MPSFELDHPLCFGHRGFPAKCPENTMVSFETAIAAGVDGIELDVTLSADNQVVVIHDATLDRTTNAQGAVSDRSWDELSGLDAGGWFGAEFEGARLPLLDEVLAALGQKTLINIEIKPEAWCAGADPDIEQRVLDLIHKHGVMDSVLVSSFNYQILLNLRSLDENLRLGVLVTGNEDNIDYRSLTEAVDAFSFHTRAAVLTPEVVDLFHEDSVLVLCWAGRDVAEQGAMDAALSAGADGFFANDPGLFLRLRDGV